MGAISNRMPMYFITVDIYVNVSNVCVCMCSVQEKFHSDASYICEEC